MSMETVQEKFLHIENVYKAYGNKTVLDDVDLAVSQGEFCTVVGPSGCGKSTLLRLILGQELPTKGKVHLEGEHIGFPDTRRGIVYQKYSLYPHLTVLENVMLGGVLSGGMVMGRSRRRTVRDEAMEYLERMRLGGQGGKYPHELSGGMQQRVAIAQALAVKPKVLLMDEPFGALDPGTREHMQIYILELWEQTGMTVFFVTHDLEEALFVGTRLIVLSQYYTDGRGQTVVRGARIVADYKVKDRVSSTRIKETEDFNRLIAAVRREGFDPAYLQHCTEFNLKHPDSFQTLQDIEKTK